MIALAAGENPLLDWYRAQQVHMREAHPEFYRSGFPPDRQPWWWGCTWCLERGDDDIDIRQRWAYAVPTPGALAYIAAWSPRGVIEVGAGAGYWAAMLAATGVDVVATDVAPPGEAESWFARENLYFEVQQLDAATAAAAHPERTLFFCWPPMTDAAQRALLAYRGDHVVYIGEGAGGCNASDDFFDELERRWRRGRSSLGIPQFSGIHDRLECSYRKSR